MTRHGTDKPVEFIADMPVGSAVRTDDSKITRTTEGYQIDRWPDRRFRSAWDAWTAAGRGKIRPALADALIAALAKHLPGIRAADVEAGAFEITIPLDDWDTNVDYEDWTIATWREPSGQLVVAVHDEDADLVGHANIDSLAEAPASAVAIIEAN